ncbi:hypothetical protein SDC9_67353 [bioreactor metagenome]|uniref:Uncharacterized protein n=1 Tax=bioreactor metagenome TaxID=1076179 RepID=A0A644XXK3_9ZZZZ|nr:RHS repeat-associated core domain-containing protein [Paludibacter sp.]
MDYIGNIEYQIYRYFDWDVTFEPAELKYIFRVHNPEGFATNATTTNGPIYSYYRKDHLGNNREVWRASYTWGSTTHPAVTVQRTQYYPSGLPWKYNIGDNPGSQPYKYGGKEFVEMHGLDEYDSDARWYYPAIMRTTTPDPLAEKYYDISPYAWCGNNPVNRIDPDGRDWYFFNKSTGQFDRKEQQEGTHRMVIHSVEKTKEGYEYDSYTFVDFADPVEDAKDIDNGQITQYISVTDKEIQSMLDAKGAFDSGKIGFGWQSQGGKDFDYSYTTLPYKYSQAEFNPTTMKSNALFLPEGDYTAHNYMNFGNYLWGATGYTVGLSYVELQIGAHLNSRFNSKRNNYPAQWDSKDDQRSIILGIYHAQSMNYRKKRK